MKQLDEEAALAIVFANTKRKRRTADLVTVAEAFEALLNIHESQKRVAQQVGLSSEMVREFRSILRLPRDVQGLIRARKIDDLETAYRISMLGSADRQREAARAALGLATKDVRDIERLVAGGGMSVPQSTKAVLKSKLAGLHVFVMDFDDDAYKAIAQVARQRSIAPAELVRQVVLRWLRRHKGSAARTK